MLFSNTGSNLTGTVGYQKQQYIPHMSTSVTIHAAYLPQVLSSLMYAAAGALFYKRSFNKSMFPILGTLLCFGVFNEHFTQLNVPFKLAYTFVIIARLIKVNDGVFTSRSYVLFVVVLFLAILDVRYDTMKSVVPYWTRIFPTAIAQFIRRPIWLKARLQGLRSKFGPLYLLYVSRTAIDSFGDVLFIRSLALISFVSANMAGCIFRPDNRSVIEQFYPGTTLAWRRCYHGKLMLLSLAAITVLICLQHIM